MILLYHSVGDTDWATKRNTFIEQVNWLSDHTQLLSLSELINAKATDDQQVAISFDDGYASLYNEVYPIVSQKNIKPIVYINTAWIMDTEQNRKCSDALLGHYPNESFLIWPEVKELYSHGWEIGSHGANHYDFTLCRENILQNELTISKQHIENQLHSSCLHFSYPWGRHSKNVKQVLKSCGYKYAVATHHLSVTRRSDPFALPRINIANDYSLSDFKEIVRGKWDYIGWVHKLKAAL